MRASHKARTFQNNTSQAFLGHSQLPDASHRLTSCYPRDQRYLHSVDGEIENEKGQVRGTAMRPSASERKGEERLRPGTLEDPVASSAHFRTPSQGSGVGGGEAGTPKTQNRPLGTCSPAGIQTHKHPPAEVLVQLVGLRTACLFCYSW